MTEQAGHTPADQWKAHSSPYLRFSTIIIGGFCCEIKTPNHAADAMVAAAAPDLLEALKAIIAQYDASPDGPLGKGFTNGPFLAARAAILKATKEK